MSDTDKLTSEDMNKLGSFIARLIRVRTRLGFGVKEEGGQREKLAPLKGKGRPSESTIKQREYFKKLKTSLEF